MVYLRKNRLVSSRFGDHTVPSLSLLLSDFIAMHTRSLRSRNLDGNHDQHDSPCATSEQEGSPLTTELPEFSPHVSPVIATPFAGFITSRPKRKRTLSSKGSSYQSSLGARAGSSSSSHLSQIAPRRHSGNSRASPISHDGPKSSSGRGRNLNRRASPLPDSPSFPGAPAIVLPPSPGNLANKVGRTRIGCQAPVVEPTTRKVYSPRVPLPRRGKTTDGGITAVDLTKKKSPRT